MRQSILRTKSKAFALRIIKLYKYLKNELHETVISKQILRSGTSIGACIAEAYFAESDGDFIHKLAISQKESNETIYWLELLYEGEFITDEKAFESIYGGAVEIQKLLTASIKTVKRKINSDKK